MTTVVDDEIRLAVAVVAIVEVAGLATEVVTAEVVALAVIAAVASVAIEEVVALVVIEEVAASVIEVAIEDGILLSDADDEKHGGGERRGSKIQERVQKLETDGRCPRSEASTAQSEVQVMHGIRSYPSRASRTE